MGGAEEIKRRKKKTGVAIQPITGRSVAVSRKIGDLRVNSKRKRRSSPWVVCNMFSGGKELWRKFRI